MREFRLGREAGAARDFEEPVQNPEEAQEVGRVHLNPLTNPESRFTTGEDMQITNVFQKHTNTRMLVSRCGSEVKLYQITDDNSINFESSHVVSQKFNSGCYHTHVSENYIWYFFRKSEINEPDRERNLNFFEKNGITMAADSTLIFTCDLEIGRGEVIGSKFFGEVKESNVVDPYSGSVYDISEYPFSRSKRKLSQLLLRRSSEIFLARIDGRNPNLIQRLARFNLDRKESKHYEEKLIYDKRNKAERPENCYPRFEQ